MSDETPEQDIPEEIAVEQRIIPYMGDDLAAALTSSGDVYVHLNAMIAALGLNTRGQTQRIQRTTALARGLRRIPLETSGGLQRVNCLRVDKIALWLAGVETNKVKEPFRAKIEAYQDELAPVATRVFMRMMGIPSAPPVTDPRLAALAEQYDVLMTAATFIAEHMEDLSALPGQVQSVSDQLTQAVHLLESLAAQQGETAASVARLTSEQKLTPAQKQHIKDAVNRIADDSAGKPGALSHGQIYAALYRHFHVSTYSELPTTRYEEVMTFLRDLWKRATSGATPEQTSLF